MAVQNEAKDPAAAALLAIEEALNLVKQETPTPTTATQGPTEPRGRAAAAIAMGGPLATPRTSELPAPEIQPFSDTGRAAPRPMIPAGLHANDDRHSVGQLLQGLQTRSSSVPFVAATIGSLFWVLACGYGLHAAGVFADGLSAASLGQPAVLGAVGALIGPVVFFFVVAALMRRTQEMRLTTRAMAEIAARLAEPETIATEQVVILSHAIRREVASMGDGIERALARAGELENLVRNEVASLERSYTDNERRMRSMIDELVNEREAVVTNADRMRGAISGAHETLARDLDARDRAAVVERHRRGPPCHRHARPQGPRHHRRDGRCRRGDRGPHRPPRCGDRGPPQRHHAGCREPPRRHHRTRVARDRRPGGSRR